MIKKRIISWGLAFAFAFALAPAPAIITANAQASGFTPITGWDMMAELGVGYTFANTTEARPWPVWHTSGWVINNPLDFETCWGQPKIERESFQRLAERGFSSYRMCVTWTPHLTAGGTINPIWMNRIQELVDWALDAGLYVILNTHHEEELYWLIRDGKHSEAKAHLTNIWAQIAEHFKDYPETLIFEIMNEPMLKEHYNSGENIWIHDPDGTVNRVLRDTVNKLNADALDVIRKSGGNNVRRVVMLCVPGAHPAALPYMEVPDDPYIMLGTFGYGSFINERTIPLITAWLDKGVGFVNKEDTAGAYGHPAATPANVRAHFGRLAELGIPSFWFAASHDRESDTAFLWRQNNTWLNVSLMNALFDAYQGFKPLEALPQKADTFATTDALNILRHVAGTAALTSEQRTRYGLGDDISTADALLILRKIAGVI
jgi:hypothetical protein